MNILLFHGKFANDLPEHIANCLPDCDWLQLNNPIYAAEEEEEEGDILYCSDKLDLSLDLATNLENYKKFRWIQDRCTRLVVNQLPEVSNVLLTECLTLDQVEIVRTAAKRLGHNLIVFTE